MCMSLHPSKMSSTIIYAGEATKDNKTVHILAYQNKAESDGPNAMVLPIPAKNIGIENVLDTRKYSFFLSDLIEHTRILYRSMSKGLPSDTDSLDRDISFDVGSYTVIVADTTDAARTLIKTVDKKKRPDLNEDVLSGIYDLYRDWPIAICCWNGNIAPEPLLFWYEPLFTEKLFAPGVDAHDGRRPQYDRVGVDATVMFGKRISASQKEIHYTNHIPLEAKSLLPNVACGSLFRGTFNNGDYWADARNIGIAGDVPKVYRKFPGAGEGVYRDLNGNYA